MASVTSGRQGKTQETQKTTRLIDTLVACALLALLAATGCAIQDIPADSKLGSPGTANSAEPSLPVAQAPQAETPPTAKPSPMPQPTLARNPTPSPLPSPSATSTSVPTPTPTPTPVLRQLIQGGCCTQPFWSQDSSQVMFIDKPGADLPTGIWALTVDHPEPTPELLTERIAFYTPDLTLLAELSEDGTIFERLTNHLSPAASPSESNSTGSGSSSSSETGPATDMGSSSEVIWEVPSEGQPVYVSPGQTRIAWQKSDYDLPPERRTVQIWVADLEGSVPQMVANLPRGGFSGWISDEVVLLSGRESLEAQEQTLFTLSLVDGSTVELARGKRLRGELLSQDGAWLAYFVALDEDPEQNGTWVVRTRGSERHKLPGDLFGAYQWRDAHRLLIIPFRPDADIHEIWEFDASTAQTRQLTDPDRTPFKIANGDWAVSPDGRHVAFVESSDRNIWLLRLPD